MTDPISRRRFLKASSLALGSTTLPAISPVASAAMVQAGASTPPDVTRQLASYVVNSEWDDIPDGARYEAVRSMFNWVGCCLGGARHVTTDRALAALAEFSGRPEATVLGRSERLDVMHAALVNGITSHVLDYDDTHLETIIHPAGPVASAILALGERQHTSGVDFIHAFVLGVEVECRIASARRSIRRTTSAASTSPVRLVYLAGRRQPANSWGSPNSRWSGRWGLRPRSLLA